MVEMVFAEHYPARLSVFSACEFLLGEQQAPMAIRPPKSSAICGRFKPTTGKSEASSETLYPQSHGVSAAEAQRGDAALQVSSL